MRRIQFYEIHDLACCPRGLRDALTDLLQVSQNFGNHYKSAVPRLRRALEIVQTHRIVDLCSGGGGPWARVLRQFDVEGYPVEVLLTDKYPNIHAREGVGMNFSSRLQFEATSVDATDLPAELIGFRTLFTSFHHFEPDAAKAILADAVRKRQGIAIFEFTRRHPLAILFMILSPLAVLAVPFIRRFRGSRLFWGLIASVAVAPFDGIVSCLRTYSPAELRAMVETFGDCGYTWEIGEDSSGPFPVPVTYLVGYPRAPASKPQNQ
jgi:hypothetical protein